MSISVLYFAIRLLLAFFNGITWEPLSRVPERVSQSLEPDAFCRIVTVDSVFVSIATAALWLLFKLKKWLGTPFGIMVAFSIAIAGCDSGQPDRLCYSGTISDGGITHEVYNLENLVFSIREDGDNVAVLIKQRIEAEPSSAPMTADLNPARSGA